MSHPEKLGKYPITAVLGEGAMGVVYKAHDPGIGRAVAIKTVRADLLNDPFEILPNPAEAADGMAARFRNEARAVGRISHPGIVAIYEYGEDAGVAFIAMEYVEGKTLAQLLASGPLLPEPEILRVMDQLLDALACAHEAGVWHRDIKPANLIITAAGRVKVTDFGIARIENAGLTLVNSQIGTPGYMAPEQYSGEGVDHRVDLYAAGVLLYRMLTGRKPFEGAAASVMFKVMHQDPLPPSQVEEAGRPAGYDAIIARALARAPADRFASAAEFRRALAQRLQPSIEAGSGITDMPTLLRRLPTPAVSGAAGPEPGIASTARATGAQTGSSSALAPTGWDEQVLAPVERALASVVGPMARVMLRQAARQHRELGPLAAALAAQIDNEADRARFLARLESGTTQLTRGSNATAATARSGGPSGTAASGPAAAAGQPSEAQVAHATQVLTRHLGPIARVLVKKALAQQPGPARFAELLADMAEGVDRSSLLRELLAPPK
jgi:serine/threonine protein kinase